MKLNNIVYFLPICLSTKALFSKRSFIFNCVCECVWTHSSGRVIVSAIVYRGQKSENGRAWSFRQLRLPYGCWELTLGPLRQQQLLFTAEKHLSSTLKKMRWLFNKLILTICLCALKILFSILIFRIATRSNRIYSEYYFFISIFNTSRSPKQTDIHEHSLNVTRKELNYIH